jgi:hypothetical protein
MDDNRVGYWLAKAVTRSFAMTHKASALQAEAEEAIKAASPDERIPHTDIGTDGAE